MTRKVTALMLAAAIAATSAAFASQATKPAATKPTPVAKAAEPTKATQATKPAPKKSAKATTVVGTLDKYDDASRMVTVTTGKGAQQFSLGPSAAIRQGSKKLTAADLGSHSGANVKVRYTESGNQMVASSITITSESKGKTEPKGKKK